MCRAVCRRVATERRGRGFTHRAGENRRTREIEARTEETPHILISADMPIPITEAVAESEPPITEITAEEKTETSLPTTPRTVPILRIWYTVSEPYQTFS